MRCRPQINNIFFFVFLLNRVLHVHKHIPHYKWKWLFANASPNKFFKRMWIYELVWIKWALSSINITHSHSPHKSTTHTHIYNTIYLISHSSIKYMTNAARISSHRWLTLTLRTESTCNFSWREEDINFKFIIIYLFNLERWKYVNANWSLM